MASGHKSTKQVGDPSKASILPPEPVPFVDDLTSHVRIGPCRERLFEESEAEPDHGSRRGPRPGLPTPETFVSWVHPAAHLGSSTRPLGRTRSLPG